MHYYRTITAWLRSFEQHHPTQMQFARYVVMGGSTALLELVSFILLIQGGMWHRTANIIAFAIALVYGFFVQKYITFRNKSNRYVQQSLKFFAVVGVGFILTNIYIYLFIDVWHWQPFISKFVQLWLVMITNYLGQRWFTFKTA